MTENPLNKCYRRCFTSHRRLPPWRKCRPVFALFETRSDVLGRRVSRAENDRRMPSAERQNSDIERGGSAIGPGMFRFPDDASKTGETVERALLLIATRLVPSARTKRNIHSKLIVRFEVHDERSEESRDCESVRVVPLSEFLRGGSRGRFRADVKATTGGGDDGGLRVGRRRPRTEPKSDNYF